MKLLIYTPTWETQTGTAMRPETAASIEALERRDGLTWDWIVSTHNPNPNQSHQNVLAQYQRGREMALEGGYDGLLTIEHDMDVPREAAWKLAETARAGADLVYGAYLLRHGSWVLNTWEYVGDRNLGESLSLMPRKLAAARAQGTVRVCGCGFGCTLITRPVLEALPMRRDTGDQWCPDIPLAIDSIRAGYVSMARLDVACGHYDKGRWLTPFETGMKDEIEVVANDSMNVAVVTNSMTLIKGTHYLIPRDVAHELERAGYVKVVTSDERRVTSEEQREAEAATLEPAETAVVRKAVKRRGL